MLLSSSLDIVKEKPKDMLAVDNNLTVSRKVGIGTKELGAKLEVAGNVKLQAGEAVNEFSSDVTLSGMSDQVVPTEKAVKTYVDNRLPRGVICM